MHKRGLCRHAVSVCICVYVTFVLCVNTNKDTFEIFSPLGSHTILIFLGWFSNLMGWRYSDGNSPNADVECRWGRQKSRFWAYMHAADTATGEVSLTSSLVDDGHCLASCDTYIAGRILRVFDNQAPCAIKSLSPWFFSARATKHALALYTITIDRMYYSKAWRYAEDNRTEYALVNPKLEVTNNKKTALEVLYYWRNEANYRYPQTRSIVRPVCDCTASYVFQ